MNIFRTIATKAHRMGHNVDQPATESIGEPVPQVQRTRPPVDDGHTKADEMMRFMAERRKRFNKKI